MALSITLPGQKVNIRSDRYAITGNPNARPLEYTKAGKVVTYKTNKGEIETGLLMPKNWQPGQLARDPRNEIKTAEEGVEHLSNQHTSIRTSDGLSIHHRYGYFVIEVPKSRREGGKYYLDQGTHSYNRRFFLLMAGICVLNHLREIN